jgi:glycosyltransferase involved in cell wall biosynthesis
VLLLVENNPYPFDVRVRREAHALRDAGYQVTVVSPRAKDQPKKEIIDGVDVFRFPLPTGGTGAVGYALEFGYSTLAMLLLSIWILLREGVDVIHAANPPDTLFVIGAVAKPFGKKFVFDQHDLSPETYLSRFKQPRENVLSRMLRGLERCSYAVADVVIATNESYRRLAVERGRKRADQVFVVRNGPPLSFQLSDPDPDLARRAEHVIGYIGTMGPQDGVDYWLRAIRHIVFTLERRDFLAVIIGTGDAARGLHALSRELEIEPYVWFTGRIPDQDARAYLSTAQVCVHPDPLSPLNDLSTMNKMMEYMALGKPAVAFDLVETRYSAQEAALYATPNDELEFAKLVCWLLDHPEERDRMGELGRQRIASSLAWEYSVPQLLRAYGEGLGISTERQRPFDERGDSPSSATTTTSWRDTRR